MVSTIARVLRRMVEGDNLAILTYIAAQRGLNRQLAAGRQAEIQMIEDGAGDPAVFGYAGHGGKAHAGCAANNIKDGRYRLDASGRIHVSDKIDSHSFFQLASQHLSRWEDKKRTRSIRQGENRAWRRNTAKRMLAKRNQRRFGLGGERA